MQSFVYQAPANRVVFGAGSVSRLEGELDALGASRVMVISTPTRRAGAEAVCAALGGRVAGIHDQAVMHVPMETAEAGRQEARRLDADCLLAVGGGSTIGLAKAIALTAGLPIVAVPSTYSGSEMTPIWGMTEAGVKTTGRDPAVLPRVVVYDPELSYGLPAEIAGPSGMNAIAHCVEALYAQDANPVTSLMAEEGIRAMGEALTRIGRDPADEEGRALGLYGAWLAGACLGTVGMALHHKLCHTLGGSFGLPHAEVHTVIVPYAAAYNAAAAPEAMVRIARALGSDDAAAGLQALAAAVGAPTALKSIGMRHEDLDRAAELAVQKPYYNPAPVTRDGVRRLLEVAFEGGRPVL